MRRVNVSVPHVAQTSLATRIIDANEMHEICVTRSTKRRNENDRTFSDKKTKQNTKTPDAHFFSSLCRRRVEFKSVNKMRISL